MSFLTRNNLNRKRVLTHQDVAGVRTLQDIKDIVLFKKIDELTVYAWGSLKSSFMKIKQEEERKLRNCLFEKDEKEIRKTLDEIEILRKKYFLFK